LEDKFRTFGLTHDYNEVSGIQEYKNQLHHGSIFHLQKLVAHQRTHLGKCKIGFNDKRKSKIRHTIGELGCDLERALDALTKVRIRRKRSSTVGANTAKYAGAEVVPFAKCPKTHW
jgi:hypothetical protein